MKKLLILLINLIIIQISFAQKACPLNIDSLSIKEVEKNINNWNGKMVAFEGIVREIKIGHVEKAYYKIALGMEHLWIGGHTGAEYMKIGQIQRVLGILCIDSADEINKLYNDKKYFILSIAFIDMQTKQASVFPDMKYLFDEWAKGKIHDFGPN